MFVLRFFPVFRETATQDDVLHGASGLVVDDVAAHAADGRAAGAGLFQDLRIHLVLLRSSVGEQRSSKNRLASSASLKSRTASYSTVLRSFLVFFAILCQPFLYNDDGLNQYTSYFNSLTCESKVL